MQSLLENGRASERGARLRLFNLSVQACRFVYFNRLFHVRFIYLFLEWSDIKNHTLNEHGGYLTSEHNSGGLLLPLMFCRIKMLGWGVVYFVFDLKSQLLMAILCFNICSNLYYRFLIDATLVILSEGNVNYPQFYLIHFSFANKIYYLVLLSTSIVLFFYFIVFFERGF